MQVFTMKTAIRIAISLALACSFAAAQQAPADQPGQAQERRGFGAREFRGVAGQITEISGSTLKIKLRDGSTGTVNITSDTRFRKAGQQAQLSDFKVGDNVMVRGDSTGDKTWTAQVVGEGPSQAQMQEMQQRMKEAMGKTIVVGDVKSIDPPKLTVTRTDGVEQTLEADENTSFRKGRDESITMPDIKVGDTIFARGELKNGTFVPTAVNVVPPEMARRMKENGGGMFFADGGPRRQRQDQQPGQSETQPK
jgi:Cu/Ag efflux protein CusF